MLGTVTKLLWPTTCVFSRNMIPSEPSGHRISTWSWVWRLNLSRITCRTSPRARSYMLALFASWRRSGWVSLPTSRTETCGWVSVYVVREFLWDWKLWMNFYILFSWVLLHSFSNSCSKYSKGFLPYHWVNWVYGASNRIFVGQSALSGWCG